MIITIKNCNNIENTNILIKENMLNIKYAINGTGKTTISQAICCYTNDKQKGTATISDLKPFKYLGQEDHNPDVLGVDHIKIVKVFDEQYLNDYVFLPDELLKGSFDILIRDENYKKGMNEIDRLVETLRKMFTENTDIDDLITDFNELSGSFGKPTQVGIHGSSAFSKAFKNGNKIANIPEGLDEYKDFIQSDQNYKWIKWQIDGRTYLDISEHCPYCTNNIMEKKPTITRVGEVYDAKYLEHLNLILGVFQRLNKYFSEDTKLVIEDFTKNVHGYTEDQVIYLKEIKDQIDGLNDKFKRAKNIGFNSLKDVDKVIDSLNSYIINLNLYNHLQSESTKVKVDIVNNSITLLLIKAGELQGSIVKQKRLIEKLVLDNSHEINGFLKNAGFQYHVNLVENENGEYKLKLIHNDITDEVSNVKAHLSFGERNAFSLLLFMYDALKSNPDIIVLDDPISSFDKNKKYAIIEMLFRKEKSFRGKTVLLLTHDFEPIIDMVYHHSNKFAPPNAAFLENVKGSLLEKTITKSDIKTFIEINNENINKQCSEINKMVYLRRLYEVTNEKCFGYQLISNLLHKRDIPIIKNIDDEHGCRPMEPNEIAEGIREIQKKIPSFNYQDCLNKIKDNAEMKKLYFATNNNYEKLHIYRIIFADQQERMNSDIILKFINEAFHLENDFIYQLNPCDYQLVPQYVIDECDKIINEL
jgi:hypothetical protein